MSGICFFLLKQKDVIVDTFSRFDIQGTTTKSLDDHVKLFISKSYDFGAVMVE